MSHFIFKAKKPNGEIYTAERDAADRYELYRLIHDSGDEFVSLKEKGKKAGGLKMEINFGFSKKVKPMDKINFSRNLGSMIEAGHTPFPASSSQTCRARAVGVWKSPNSARLVVLDR